MTTGLSVDQSGLIAWQDKSETFTVTITSYEARMLYMAIKKQGSFVAAGTAVRVVGKGQHCLLHLSSGWNLATFGLSGTAATRLLAALHRVGSRKG